MAEIAEVTWSQLSCQAAKDQKFTTDSREIQTISFCS